MERRLTLLLVVFALVVIGLLPLAAMLGKSIFVDGRLTLATYQKLFADPWQQWIPMGRSLTLAALTAGCVTLIGVPLGLLLGKSDLPFRRILAVLLSIPLVLPPYIFAVCWFNLLARDGVLVHVIPAQTVELLSRWLFGLPGCLWVLVSAFLPVVMILTLVYVRAVDPRLEEAGRLISRWPAILRYVTLPMILPGILFGGILVFLLALGEVGVPMFLRYPVFPLETLTQFSAFYDFGAAAAAATPLLALVVSSLSPFAYLDAWDQAADSLRRSLVFAGVGATLLTGFGFFCGYLIHHRALRLWRAVDTVTLLLFTLPGTVIGVGLIALWNRPATGFLYASAAMVILAYLAQYTALTSRITLATLAGIPQSLEEAAQMTGAPWLARIWHVVVPAAIPGVIAAWLIGFIFCLRDLGASMLVYPAGQDTLPVRIFTLMANGAPSFVSALCVIMVAATLSALAILGSLFRATASHR